ncbi:BLUF domain-containing protein [Caldimonas brevitalea]|uniref:BLUF domain-containing protein n=1 Tax=Caldimonas brevitalea TaxID=413882 RepID=A0A0G3BLA8_9BURK|nr:BLUF domain-containing protein [Caldimonas brevitalea]AKJ30249.1 hypothetical protein AAW51_3558 [Caldimonas brevitalea]
MLEQLVYISRVSPAVTRMDVQRILWVSQIRNRRLDVTGMLALIDSHFVQVLEGRSEALTELMQRIGQDPRHEQLRVLVHEPIDRRRFASWSMGLVDRHQWTREAEQLCQTGRVEGQSMDELIGRLFAEEP